MYIPFKVLFITLAGLDADLPVIVSAIETAGLGPASFYGHRHTQNTVSVRPLQGGGRGGGYDSRRYKSHVNNEDERQRQTIEQHPEQVVMGKSA